MNLALSKAIGAIWIFLSLLALLEVPLTTSASSMSLNATVQTELPFYSQGEKVRFFGTITDSSANPIQGSNVALEVRRPDSSTVFLDIVTSYANGSYYDSFRLPLPTQSGTYTAYVVASKAGYTSCSNQTSFDVAYPNGASLAVWTMKASYMRFENATVYGRLLYNGTPIQDSQTTFTMTYPNQTVWRSVSNTTNIAGVANCIFYLPPTIPAGQYYINGSSYKEGYDNATAYAVFTVQNQEPTIYNVTINPQIIEKPDTTNIEANASDYEDYMNLTLICIFTFPNQTVQILNMTLVGPLFTLQYSIPSTYPSGTYSLTIRAIDHDAGSCDYQTTFEVITPVLKGSAYGWIMDNTGRSIPNSTVTLSLKTAYLTYTAIADSSGYYSFSYTMVGDYGIIVSAEGYAKEIEEISISIGPAVIRNITLYHLPVLRGAITNQNGEPIFNASVTATGGSGMSTTTTTLANGSYCLVISSEGSFTVTASAPDYSPNSTAVTFRMEQTTELNLWLTKNGKIVGQVLDARSGLPVTTATAFLQSQQFADQQTTNSSGYFMFNSVPQSNYAISVTADDYLPNSTTLTISSDATVFLQIDITSTGNITGTVKDSTNGFILSGAVVSLQDSSGITLAAVRTGSNGKYLFYLVDPGNYSLEACLYGYNSTKIPVNVAALNVSTADCVLDPSIIFLKFESSSDQFSRGETADFNMTATNAQGHSIVANLTEITVKMKGPSNETRDLNPSLQGNSYVFSYAIQSNETLGVWTISVHVKDYLGSAADSTIVLLIQEAFLMQFQTDKSSYVQGETANFTASASRYSNTTQCLNSSQIAATVVIRNAQNTSIASLNLTSSGNELTGVLDLSGLPYGLYSALVTVTDANNNSGEASLAFAVVQDYRIVVNTDKPYYNRTENVFISGSVAFTNGTPITGAGITIALIVKGYMRSFQTQTDLTGAFSYVFTPYGNDAGNYSLQCYTIINGIPRIGSINFSILGLTLNPSHIIVYMAENSNSDFAIEIRNDGETNLTQLSVDVEPPSMNGVTFNVLTNVQSALAAGATTNLVLRLIASQGAIGYSTFNLTVTSAQGATEFGCIEVYVELATPIMEIIPGSIDVSLAQGQYATQTVTVKNIGYAALLNVSVGLPSNDWIMPTSTGLGDIKPQESQEFDILVRPGNDTHFGLYQDQLEITSSNGSPMSLYIAVRVNSGVNGSLVFHVIDQGGSPVENSSVMVQYQEYWVETSAMLTNSTGYCIFSNLLAGMYAYRVSADNYQSVTGTAVVNSGSTNHVEVTCQSQLMEVKFSVQPSPIQDKYTIILNMTFETQIPPPLLVPIPMPLLFQAKRAAVFEKGYDATSNFQIVNTGLVSVFNVTVSLEEPAPSGYTLSFGLSGSSMHFDEIKAKSYENIPCELAITPGEIITDLPNNNVGKIKIEGYCIFFDDNSQPQTMVLTASQTIKLIDTGTRGLSVDPWCISCVKTENGFEIATPVASGSLTGYQQFPDITITDCADSESVYISPYAVGGGFSVGCQFDLSAHGLKVSVDAGYFLAVGKVTTTHAVPRVVVSTSLVQVDYTVPWETYLASALSQVLQPEPWLSLDPGQSAFLLSEKWEWPLDVQVDFKVKLLDFLNGGISYTGGGILIPYRWQLDHALQPTAASNAAIVWISILDINGPSITLPIIDVAGIIKSLIGNVTVPHIDVDIPWIQKWNPPNWTINWPPVRPWTPVYMIEFENDTVHEIVKLSIQQEATLERDVFTATLDMTNKLTSTNIEKVSTRLDITFENGTDASQNFIVNPVDLQNISAIDGTGAITPGATARVCWSIIPKPGAGGMDDSGQYYNIKAEILYSVNQTYYTTDSCVETIQVKPQPLLKIDYYLPQNVLANKPFKLAVRVTNIGNGTAHNFGIDSAQPIIYDNVAGLQMNFQITGAFVQGNPSPTSLRLFFGDLSPNSTVLAYWLMVASRTGNFTDFTANFVHDNTLGGQETSLIKSPIQSHIIMRDVMIDNVSFAFLVDSTGRGVPDEIMDSYGLTWLVNPASCTIVGQTSTSLSVQTQKAAQNWISFEVADPFNNLKQITQITRSDGKVLSPYNYWMANGKIYVVDDPEENYTVLFSQPLSVTVSPSSAVMDVGESLLLASTVSGGITPYSYQWYLNDAPVSGATNSIWTFTPSVSGSYKIYVKVTDNVGSEAESNIASFTVNPSPPSGGGGGGRMHYIN